MIEINIYEQKFLDILKGENSLEVFENWLYKNEEMLTTQMSSDVYNELILLNFKSKDTKHELANTLNIDYAKLELYEIQEIIKSELIKEPILNNIKYEIDVYDFDFISFDFKIGFLNFRMHNPFNIDNFVNLSNAERENIFCGNFGNENNFLVSLLDAIGTDNFRVYNWKQNEQTENKSSFKLNEVMIDEYKIMINGHHCFIKKEYIKQQMKNAWL